MGHHRYNLNVRNKLKLHKLLDKLLDKLLQQLLSKLLDKNQASPQ
jgi:hypothetical protein